MDVNRTPPNPNPYTNPETRILNSEVRPESQSSNLETRNPKPEAKQS